MAGTTSPGSSTSRSKQQSMIISVIFCRLRKPYARRRMSLSFNIFVRRHMARRVPQASSSLKARRSLGSVKAVRGICSAASVLLYTLPALTAPNARPHCRTLSVNKNHLPASVPALVGAGQHHLPGLGLPTTLPEGSLFSCGHGIGGADVDGGLVCVANRH